MIQINAGWETTVCQKEVCVLLHVTLLLLPTVRLQKFYVTWVGLVPAGTETIACQKDLFVHQLAILHLQACVVQQMLSVTWAMIQINAGWETTVCQKEVCVLLHVTLLLLPTVRLQKFYV